MAASAFTMLTGAAQAEGDMPVARATSVAEMLHNKQMREQLTREGRFDEIRRLDENQKQKLRAKQEQLYAKLNNEPAMCEVPAGNRFDEPERSAANANPVSPLLGWFSSLLSDGAKSK
jgi:hypothetical protein